MRLGVVGAVTVEPTLTIQIPAGHIKDLGHDPNSPTTRLFATSAAQPFHNDSSGKPGHVLCPL